MSTLAVNSITDASGGSNAILYGAAAPTGGMNFRNRIINGDMRIDQRNAGSAVSTAGAGLYTLDRWIILENGSMVFSVQRTTTAPTGFTNALLVTTTTGASPSAATRSQIAQNIEGFNVADLGWGTANAQAVTLSFQVRSSLTGTFGGSLVNSAENRSYPFTYSISSANTYEYKTVTIPGDTSGTWLTDNGVGLRVIFDLGAGSDLLGTAGSWTGSDRRGATGGVKLSETTNATWYITGVQLEAGSVATPFERRPYGTELALCQRYYWRMSSPVAGDVYYFTGLVVSNSIRGAYNTPVTMRTSSTIGFSNASHFYGYDGSATSALTSVANNQASNQLPGVQFILTGNLTTGRAGILISNSSSAWLDFSSEL